MGCQYYRCVSEGQALRGGLIRLAVIIVAGLVATACGTSVEVGDVSTEPGDPVAGEVGDTAALVGRDLSGTVEFLGDAASAVTSPVEVVIGPRGGVIEVGDGSVVTAPAGAFGAGTALAVQAFAVDFSSITDDEPWAQVYVASTVDDVDLGVPISIELDRSPEGLAAVQIIDGEVRPVEVLGDERAHIEIPHFSDVMTFVTEAIEPLPPPPRSEEERTDAEFLRTCIQVTLQAFQVNNVERTPASELALWSWCTDALVRRASPTGVTVSTACVGDAIDDDTDFREAIAECAANDERAESDDRADEAEAAGSSDHDAAGGEADSAPTHATTGRWSGETTHAGSRSVYEGSATIELRDGIYTLDFFIASDSDDGCSTSTVMEGEASATPNENGRLVFISQTVRQIASDCKFYESRGGYVEEEVEYNITGYLLDDDVLRLDLLPGSSFEMDWEPL